MEFYLVSYSATLSTHRLGFAAHIGRRTFIGISVVQTCLVERAVGAGCFLLLEVCIQDQNLDLYSSCTIFV